MHLCIYMHASLIPCIAGGIEGTCVGPGESDRSVPPNVLFYVLVDCFVDLWGLFF